MHIHLPKPAHGWREFFGEVGIIVLGVLIALAAEQAVEAMHWRAEVADTRAALRPELEHDIGAVEFAEARMGCAARRLEALNAWLGAAEQGQTLVQREPIGRPTTYSMWSSAWDVAKTGQVASHIPLRDRLTYARAYTQVGNIQDLMVRQRDAWLALGQFNNATSLDHGDRMRLQGIISALNILNQTYAANVVQVRAWAAELGLQAKRLPPYAAQADLSFCRPLFAPTA